MRPSKLTYMTTNLSPIQGQLLRSRNTQDFSILTHTQRGRRVRMGVVKSAIGDMLMTFSWVVLSATFGLQTTEIISAAGFQGIAWAPLAITTFLIFFYVSIFTVVFGSASFNPTGNAAFYAAGVPGDTLFTLAIRLPAQAAGAAGGALAIMEFIPEKYKHMISGPSLQVDVHTGAIAETILSFGITFAALLIIIRGPRRLLAKTFLLALATICFVVAGSKYTGPAMNPAIAFGWAYMYSSHNTWDHFYVYWISSFVGALSAALVFRTIFPPPTPQQKKQKKA